MLPRFCPACNKKLQPDETAVCSVCLGKILTADGERLRREFERKFEAKNIISGFTSLYVFEKDKELQSIIHSLKYNQKFLTGKLLGVFLGKEKEKIFSSWQIDFIIPVPLHQLKKNERGYNQSYFLAKGISKATGLKIKAGYLKRKRFTQSQTSLNLKEREENMNGAFTARYTEKLKGRNVLLIDDVITTGATITECGRVLIACGANKVYAASAAIAD